MAYNKYAAGYTIKCLSVQKNLYNLHKDVFLLNEQNVYFEETNYKKCNQMIFLDDILLGQ